MNKKVYLVFISKRLFCPCNSFLQLWYQSTIGSRDHFHLRWSFWQKSMASNMQYVSASQTMTPTFKGENYQFWSIKIKTLLLSYDLWELVENGFAEPNDQDTRLTMGQWAELKEKQKKVAKALYFIQQALDDILFARILAATTSKEALEFSRIWNWNHSLGCTYRLHITCHCLLSKTSP